MEVSSVLNSDAFLTQVRVLIWAVLTASFSYENGKIYSTRPHLDSPNVPRLAFSRSPASSPSFSRTKQVHDPYTQMNAIYPPIIPPRARPFGIALRLPLVAVHAQVSPVMAGMSSRPRTRFGTLLHTLDERHHDVRHYPRSRPSLIDTVSRSVSFAAR